MDRCRIASPQGGRHVVGFTLVEVVVVLAVVGVVVTGGVRLLRPNAALRAADAARAFLLWGRLEAMWSGRAVAVIPEGATGLEARSDAASEGIGACGGTPKRSLDLARLGRARVLEPLRVGVVWLPTGGARSCDGGGVISGRMVVGDRARRVAVIVSSLGRVRVETLP